MAHKYIYANDCENNRIGYNQTAADILKDNYSEYTSELQQHDWKETPEIIGIAEGVRKYSNISNTPNDAFFIEIATILSAVIVIAVVGFYAAYSKLKHQPTPAKH